MSMSNSDKEFFSKGKPYLIGLIALAFRLRRGMPGGVLQPATALQDFDEATIFINEFERRNGVLNGQKK